MKLWMAILCLLLPSAAETVGDERVAVVALGGCERPDAAVNARIFRSAMARRIGARVLSETETAAPFGGLSEVTLAQLEASLATARDDYYAGATMRALHALERAETEILRLRPSPARWELEREILTLTAQLQLKSSPDASGRTLARIYSVEPEFTLDLVRHPPSFRRFANGVKAATASRPTFHLDVVVSPPGKDTYIGGKRFGPAPLSLRLPATEYRVEVDWGRRGLTRMVDSTRSTLELSAAVEGAVDPDGGPCVVGPGDPAALLRRAMVPGVGRVYGLRTGQDTYATAYELGNGGVRAARIVLEPQASVGEALDLLAGHFQNGSGGPRVEVVSLVAPSVPRPAPARPLRRGPPVAGPPDEGPEVRLLKSQVVSYEPLYAEVLHAERYGDIRSRAPAFEYRKVGKYYWDICDRDLSVVPEPRGEDGRLPLVDVRHQCQIVTPGAYELRFHGSPVGFEVLPIPPDERGAAALLDAADGGVLDSSHYHGALARSLYAGYAMVGDPSAPPPGPVSIARRLDAARTLSDAERQARRGRLAQAVDDYGAQLQAHPEFVFFRRLTLQLASALLELGRCAEARQRLESIASGEEGRTARQFLDELPALESTLCSPSPSAQKH